MRFCPVFGCYAREVALAALRGYGLTGSTAVHATRCLRVAVTGFTYLEAGHHD